jgi:hypothetical protein
MHWFCGQENNLIPTGILPSDENVQTVRQCLICAETVQVVLADSTSTGTLFLPDLGFGKV